MGLQRLILAAGLFLTCLQLNAFSGDPVRIYLANDDHTDYMWTADADRYANVFVEMLDFHLKLAKETEKNPLPFQNRFNADGSCWLWEYEQKKSKEDFDGLMEAVRGGTISAPLNTVVSCYGAQPMEAVLRGMYYSGRLERRYGLRFRMAVAMENQTLPLGLASLFSGAGASYSWRGVCGCASRMDSGPLHHRPREISWWTGHDGKRLLLKWHSLVQPGNQKSGGYSEAFDPVAAVKFLDSDETFLKRYRAAGTSEPFRVRGAFGYGWDALDRKTGQTYAADPRAYPMTDHFHVVAQKMSTPQRQVIVSNEVDFFEDFEKHYAASLEAQSVTFGNEWDLYSASMSETSARVKRAVEKLRAAEFMATLVSLKEPKFMDRFSKQRDRAFHGLGLYWEHNWTADGPISRQQRAAWQEGIARQIESYVQSLHDAAKERLQHWIPNTEESSFRFFVLNPLSWERTDYADFLYSGAKDVHVVEHAPFGSTESADSRIVLHQMVQVHGKSYLRILAEKIPSMGYKIYEVRQGPSPKTVDVQKTVHVSSTGEVLENDSARLTIERDGSIRSWIDRQRGDQELVDTKSEARINQLGQTAHQGSPLQVENSGPVSITVRAKSNAGLPHSTSITLFRGLERIEIENEIQANFGETKHWDFFFGLKEPELHAEEIGAINLIKLKSAGGDYSDTHARYDYVTVNHFADFTARDGLHGVTLSNPDLAFGRLGKSTPTKLDTSASHLSMLAGGQVDGSKLGIPMQNGQTKFTQRFALRSHAAYSATSAMKFALEHQNPLETGIARGSKEQSFPDVSFSLLEVDHSDLLLWTLKPAEEGIGSGVIARLWNMAEGPIHAEVKSKLAIKSVKRATHLETDLETSSLTEGGAIPLDLNRQQIETLRLDF